MPTGMERLLGAESIARGLEGWRVNSSEVLLFAANTRGCGTKLRHAQLGLNV